MNKIVSGIIKTARQMKNYQIGAKYRLTFSQVKVRKKTNDCQINIESIILTYKLNLKEYKNERKQIINYTSIKSNTRCINLYVAMQ